MYSQWTPPPGTIRVKNPYERRTEHAYYCHDYVADQLERNTWVVWNIVDGIVAAIFYSERNIHGWSASEAHAKRYLNRFSNVNPFELDSIP